MKIVRRFFYVLGLFIILLFFRNVNVYAESNTLYKYSMESGDGSQNRIIQNDDIYNRLKKSEIIIQQPIPLGYLYEYFGEANNAWEKGDVNYKKRYAYYYWLHGTERLLNYINTENVSYKTIAKDNDKETIRVTCSLLRTIYHEVETFNAKDSEADMLSGEIKENDKVTIRAYSAFKKITKYEDRKKYQQERIQPAIRELMAAYCYKTKEKLSDNCDINDSYEEKFKYSLAAIKVYETYFGIGRLNVGNRGPELKRVWLAKKKAEDEGYPNVATNTDLIVDLNDSYATKMSYNKDEIYLYLKVYITKDGKYLEKSGEKGNDINLGNNTGKQKGNIMVEWANMLQNNKHTKFFNENRDPLMVRKETFQGNKVNSGYPTEKMAEAERYLLGLIDGISEEELKEDKEKTEKEANDTYSTDEITEENKNSLIEDEKKDDADKNTVFKQPERDTAAAGGVEDAINDADKFVSSGNTEFVNDVTLQSFSQNMYGILLAVGVVIAVIIGTILGIKLMIAPIEERVEAKKLLVPYVVGCIVVFGAFGTWKLIVTIMQGL